MLRLMNLGPRSEYGYVGLHESTAGLVIILRIGTLDSCSVAIVYHFKVLIKPRLHGLRNLDVGEAAYYVSLIR